MAEFSEALCRFVRGSSGARTTTVSNEAPNNLEKIYFAKPTLTNICFHLSCRPADGRDVHLVNVLSSPGSSLR